ncbi:thioredoxin family protein [Streptococcus gallolyticus]|uniref:thioredoxin family protein n=1 Tax=Streptococcus hepaticus TaxID=3349163 RepID=UPI001C95CD4B|nr:thioredoxin family protein [Streptococcus gallolyticus]MBY5040849.1 thioredoxin family protein [Streptococcus gallolyticus]
MIIPTSFEEIAGYIEKEQKTVFFFTADWCPDCKFIYPSMPEIEAAFPELTFVRIDRDEFMEVAQQWDIFGIPSFVVVENGQELGRFVDKNRKSKQEIIRFLEGLK